MDGGFLVRLLGSSRDRVEECMCCGNGGRESERMELGRLVCGFCVLGCRGFLSDGGTIIVEGGDGCWGRSGDRFRE